MMARSRSSGSMRFPVAAHPGVSRCGSNRFPIWSADSQRVAFQSDREGDRGIFWQRSDGSGTAERLTKPEAGANHFPEAWSPKGDSFLFYVQDKNNQNSLWTFSI